VEKAKAADGAKKSVKRKAPAKRPKTLYTREMGRELRGGGGTEGGERIGETLQRRPKTTILPPERNSTGQKDLTGYSKKSGKKKRGSFQVQTTCVSYRKKEKKTTVFISG